jgi:uncharacterized protein (DUF3084 family)
MKIAIDKIRAVMYNIMRLHDQFSEQVRENIDAPFTELRESQKRLKRHSELGRDNHKKIVEKELASIHKSAGNYIQKCKEICQNNEKLTKQKSSSGLSNLLASSPEKADKAAYKLKVEVDKIEVDMNAAVFRLNQLLDSFDRKFVEIANDIQQSEQERLDTIKGKLGLDS